MKRSKSKKKWFKVQFEKHPYIYSALIGWPILWYILLLIDDNSKVYVEVLLIILFSFPFIIFFLWFRKNKSKAKSFYKRKKKIFNRVYFYLGSIFSLIPIACIVGIIVTGGVSNFIERTKFEINAAVYAYYEYDLCSSPFFISYSGFPKDHRIFFFKEQTQYIDYFESKIDSLVLRDLDFLNVNHCTGTRYLLKEAQKGNEGAKEILVAYPPELKELYSFPPNNSKNRKYIFSRYEKNIANMDLDNPAIAYSYAVYLDKNLDQPYWDNVEFPIKPEALKYLKQSAEDGYFLAMSRLISSPLSKNYFDINCDKFMKYINILSEEKSIVAYYNLMHGYMGKGSLYPGKTIDVYNCLNQKPNFSKAFLMLSNMSFGGSTKGPVKKSHRFKSSYPAIFYLYGLGDVKQDYDKAYELFSYSERIGGNLPSHAYLAYMNYMGMGTEQNLNKGKGLTVELAKKMPLPIEIKQLCNLKAPNLLALEYYWDQKILKRDREKKRIKYDADKKINEKIKKEYRDKLGECLLKSEHGVSIKFLEDYIFNRVSDFFKNPELVQNLNYLGKVN